MSRTTQALALALLPVAGCSLVYDGDVFVTEDAAPPDADIFDADPSGLVLEGVEPERVYEGQGCIPDGEGGCAEISRPIPIVVSGRNIVPGAEVTLRGAGFDEVSVDPVVSNRFDALAFTLQLPIDADKEAPEDLTIAVTQAGVTKERTLPIEFLPELTSADLATDPLAKLDGERYSRITITEPLDLPPGDSVARFVATAEIEVSALVTANGQSGGAGGAGGPGACSGGPPDTPGQCGIGGGRNGAEGGAGGGGYAASGNPGQGGDQGGMETGGAMLTQLDYDVNETGNRGNGGGGASGTGGGGGGSVELRSGGALRLLADAGIRATGGAGQNCSGLAGGKGAGGGSGGTVLLRAPVVEDSAGGTDVDVSGGPGGSNDCLLSGGGGGAGSAGRIRIDAADPQVSLDTEGSANRGAMVDASLPAVSSDKDVEVRVVGDSERSYGLRVNDEYEGDLTGGGTLMVSLDAGLNQVCAVAVAEREQKSDEALNCLTVAYIP